MKNTCLDLIDWLFDLTLNFRLVNKISYMKKKTVVTTYYWYGHIGTHDTFIFILLCIT